jgi:seryl-tRNA synthetase
MVQSVGNMVHKDAPVHQNEDNNRIVHTVGTLTKHDHCLPYWTVLERLDAVDMKRGQKIAGHRGYFLKGVGVKLAKALTNLSLNFL